jgi:hypothetical protein
MSHDNFPIGLDIVLGLEQRVTTNDSNDPGGLTVWGLSQVYNPEVYDGMPEAEIKDIYYRKYWKAAGCNDAPFPMDIVLFDGCVNPQNDPDLPDRGNKELINLIPENWQDFLLMRMRRYMEHSQKVFVKGHLFRVVKLYDKIKELMK